MVIFGSESYYLSGVLIQRGLALTYLLAFTIEYRQNLPLIGANGILPARDFIEKKSFWKKPSIFHLICDDYILDVAALLGISLSVMALLGISEMFTPFLSVLIWSILWIIYISFENVGQNIFQQKVLLVEAGFLAIFLGTIGTRSSGILIFMFRWLLFRVIFHSGLSKLKNDKLWRNGEAFNHFLESQPFPGPFSWNLYNLPDKIKRMMSFGVVILMLVLPFLYFAPQPYAAIAGLLTIVLQLGIMGIGSFSWLNLAVITIAFSTFSDQILGLVPGILAGYSGLQPYPFGTEVSLLAVIVFIISLRAVRDMLKMDSKGISYGAVPLVNLYGYYGNVREGRIEIIVEGTSSSDLKNADWQQYRYQVNPPNRYERPKQLAPYHHKLDYAIKHDTNKNQLQEDWFLKFMEKILENDEELLMLFKDNPFDGRTPKYVRAVKYKYSFTDPEVRRTTGRFWDREKMEVTHGPIKRIK